MVLRIFKMIATGGFLHGSFRAHQIRFRPPRTPLGSLQRSPRTHSCFKAAYILLRERGRRRGEKEGVGERKERVDKGTQIPGSAPEDCVT